MVSNVLSVKWRPGPRPEWVRALNALGDPAWVDLSEESLLAEAQRNTGLADFGGQSFREPMRIFLEALEREAKLNLIGRILARSDVLNLLENRLRMTEERRRHPEIDREEVRQPLFITGLPRTGTSILHELLGQDPSNRVPLAWEVRHPCPPPEAGTHRTDPRIARTDEELRFWNHVVPEYPTMHELGATIPVECIMLTTHEFRSDQLCGTHQVPSYAAWLAQADMRPAYRYHLGMLQLLQWRNPGERWVLKAPSHMASIEALVAVYPDARIVQTHRDPLTVMASAASILYGTAWVRSDDVDAERILSWFSGESCAYLLDGATRLRESGTINPAQFFDVRYHNLVRDPVGTIGSVYEHFGLALSDQTAAGIRAYLKAKPKDKHGAHHYSFDDTGFDRDRERERFTAYQKRYGVPSEL